MSPSLAIQAGNIKGPKGRAQLSGYVASGFYTPDTTGLAFRCLATDAAKPWMNKKSNQLERGPFLVCVKYCPALDLNEFEGVSAERGPSEKVWETGLVVFADGTYDLKCNPGYTYRPTRPNGFQTVVCDGATGQYLEINNGGANVSNVGVETERRVFSLPGRHPTMLPN